MAAEPGGGHVDEDGALIVGGVEGCEYVRCGWRVEARFVDVVDLDCVVCTIIEEGRIPSHWQMLEFALNRAFELRLALRSDVWVYFLSIRRLAKWIGGVCGPFWVCCERLMAHVRIVRAVERTGRGCGYRRSRRGGGSLDSSI